MGGLLGRPIVRFTGCSICVSRMPHQLESSSTRCCTSTMALEPLERWAHDEVDLPETYLTGI